MADDAESKETKSAETDGSTSDNQDSNKRKRRVLRPAAEPTTIREQSEKAQAKSSTPRRGSKLGRKLAIPFKAVGRFIARIFRPLGRFRIIRVIGYIFWPPYFRNSWKELRLVTWPNRRQSLRLTFAVIVFSLIFGCIVALVDYGLDKIFRALILK